MILYHFPLIWTFHAASEMLLKMPEILLVPDEVKERMTERDVW